MIITKNLFLFILEMSDEKTLREDLIIREGSSPDARKGRKIFKLDSL